MGFGVAISGTVITIIMFVFLFLTPGIMDKIMEIDDSTKEISTVEESIKDTKTKIFSMTATSGSQDVSFSLGNFGDEKLWKYDDFYLLVTYDANIGGVSTKITEHLDFVVEPPLEIDPITIDAVSSFQDNCSSCSFVHEHTVDDHASILIVGVSINGPATIDSISYGGVALTQIRADQISNLKSQLWYLVSPPNGTHSVSVNKSQNGHVVIGAITLNGVSDSHPIGSNNGATGSSFSASVSLTTSVDDAFIVDTASTGSGTLSADGTQTEHWNLDQSAVIGGGSTDVTTSQGGYTMSWTKDTLSNWAISAAEIVPHANKWAISEISTDKIEPGILNPDELATISGQLSYPIFAGGDISITLATDRGFITSLSMNVP